MEVHWVIHLPNLIWSSHLCYPWWQPMKYKIKWYSESPQSPFNLLARKIHSIIKLSGNAYVSHPECHWYLTSAWGQCSPGSPLQCLLLTLSPAAHTPGSFAEWPLALFTSRSSCHRCLPIFWALSPFFITSFSLPKSYLHYEYLKSLWNQNTDRSFILSTLPTYSQDQTLKPVTINNYVKKKEFQHPVFWPLPDSLPVMNNIDSFLRESQTNSSQISPYKNTAYFLYYSRNDSYKS